MPPKDFVPTHSAEETATINAIVEEKMTYLKEERAERRYCLIILTFLSYIENNFFFLGICSQKLIGFLKKK